MSGLTSSLPVFNQRASLFSLTRDQLAEQAKTRIGAGWGVYREVSFRALQEGLFLPEQLEVSARAQAAWRDSFHANLLEPARVQEEPSLHPLDKRETMKVALRTRDGLEIEAVRVPMSRGRTTLCVSSQVGCKLACRFCETAKLGLLRNLSPEEIVSQVVTARTRLGWKVDSIVFMGMGEPLDNTQSLLQALRVLTDFKGLAYAQHKIRICTSGVPEGLRALASLRYYRLGLSFSLNAATNPKRSLLMPINRKHPLEAVQEALLDYPKKKGFVLALNYCLLPGFNDDPSDAEAVAAFAEPLGRTFVNVIPYNPGTKPLTRAPTEAETQQFITRLQAAGLPVRQRRTKGRQVMAACGQLGNLALRRAKTRTDVHGD